MRSLDVTLEAWPIHGEFRISRETKVEAQVVVVTLTEDNKVGRGESVPSKRYGASPESTAAELRAIAPAVEQGLSRTALQQQMDAGPARNALDNALWDLEAKVSQVSAFQSAGLSNRAPIPTAFTLSLDTPQVMAEKAAAHAYHRWLKLKLVGDGDLERVQAVRTAVPHVSLIVDANESWTREQYEHLVPHLVSMGVELIEQPFPTHQDAILAELARPIAVCADESCHTRQDLEQLRGKYDFVNIKLDKTGGLTEALALKREARAQGFGVMVGCMVGTSLAMAPAVVLAQDADVVDLDGPLLLARDRKPGLQIRQGMIHPPAAELWG